MAWVCPLAVFLCEYIFSWDIFSYLHGQLILMVVFHEGKITLTVVFASGFVSFVMYVLLQFLLLLFNGKCSILANPSDIEVLLYMKVTNLMALS